MPSPKQASPPKRRRKLLRRLAWLLGLSGIGLLALFLTREQTLFPAVGWSLERLATRELGLRIEIGRIETDGHSWIRLEDVRSRGRPSRGVLEALELGEVEVRFSLADWLEGREDWIRSVSAFHGSAVLRFPGPAPTEAPFTWPEMLPELSASGLDVTVHHDTILAAVRGTEITVRADGEETWRWTLGAREASLREGANRRHWEGVSLEGRYSPRRVEVTSGQLGDDLRDLNGTLSASTVDAADLSWSATAVYLEGELTSEGHTTPLATGADLKVVQLDIDRLDEAVPWLGLPADVTGHLTVTARAVRNGDEEPRVALTLESTDCSLQTLTLDELTAEARLTPSRLTVDRLSARVGENRFEARSLEAPIRRTEVVLDELTARFETSITDLPDLLVRAGVIAPEDVETLDHEIRLVGQFRSGQLELSEASLLTGVGGAHLLSPILASLPRNGDWRSMDLQAALAIDVESLEKIAGLVGWPESTLSGRLDGELHFAGDISSPQLFGWLTGEGLTVADTPIGRLEVRATSDGHGVRLEHFEVVDGGNRLEGHGRLDLEQLWIRELHLEVDIADVAAYFPDRFDGGSLRLSVEASGDWRDPAADIFLEGSVRRLGEAIPDLVRFEARNRSGEVWVRRLRVDTGGTRVEVRGTVDHSRRDEGIWQGEVSTLRWTRGPKTLVNRAPFELSWSRGDWSVSEVDLAGPLASVRGEASGTVDGRLDLSASLTGFDTEWIGEHLPRDWPQATGIDLELEIRGRLENPDVTAGGRIADIRWRDLPPLSLRIDTRREQGVVILTRLEIDEKSGGSDWIGISASGRLPDPFSDIDTGWAEAPFELDVEARLPDLARVSEISRRLLPDSITLPELGGQLELSAALRGSLSDPGGRFFVGGTDLKLDPIPGTGIPGVERGRLELQLDRVDDRWLVRAAQLSAAVAEPNEAIPGAEASPEIQARFRGALLGPVDLGRWIRGEGLPAPRIDLRADIKVPDLEFVARMRPDLRRTSGELEGHLSLTGTLQEPQFDGTVRLREGSCRLESRLPGVDALKGSIRFDGDRVRIEKLSGEIGAGQFDVEGGVVFSGEEPEVDLQIVNGRNLLLYRADGLKVRANTDLKLTGPWSALVLSGSVDLTDARYVKNVDLIRVPRIDLLLQQGQADMVRREGLRLFSLRDAPFEKLRFDIHITSQRPFRLDNNLVRGQIRPDVQLRGTGELPFLVGTIYIDTASVSLPSTTLEFEQGVLIFPENNPFVPQFSLAAQTRMIGYDINVSMTGTYVEPRIGMSSVPPLPQDDLLMLVTTGRPPEEGFNDRNRQKAITGVVVFLGKDLLGKVFGSESTESERSVFENFEVSTGQDVTRTGQETIEARFLMARDAISQENAIYIVAERDAYGDYNGGVRLVFRLW
ncbi:MAG: translocation/assembly module TamB domain-containing protein [Planctomycetota bacterium]